jgi:hypothetical protein
MNFNDDFFSSEVDFVTIEENASSARKTFLARQRREQGPSKWTVRPLINWVAAAVFTFGVFGTVDPKIFVSSPAPDGASASAAMAKDFGLAELRALVDGFEAGVIPAVSTETLKSADRIAKALKSEADPPSQSNLETWLGHFVSSAGDC